MSSTQLFGEPPIFWFTEPHASPHTGLNVCAFCTCGSPAVVAAKIVMHGLAVNGAKHAGRANIHALHEFIHLHHLPHIGCEVCTSKVFIFLADDQDVPAWLRLNGTVVPPWLRRSTVKVYMPGTRKGVGEVLCRHNDIC